MLRREQMEEQYLALPREKVGNEFLNVECDLACVFEGQGLLVGDRVDDILANLDYSIGPLVNQHVVEIFYIVLVEIVQGVVGQLRL